MRSALIQRARNAAVKCFTDFCGCAHRIHDRCVSVTLRGGDRAGDVVWGELIPASGQYKVESGIPVYRGASFNHIPFYPSFTHPYNNQVVNDVP